MHPLSRALSRVGASESHHESKAVDTPRQCQINAVDTSQQWTSPSSWPSNDTPISNALQASDNGPSGECNYQFISRRGKLTTLCLIHDRAWGEENEPDGPHPELPTKLGHDMIPVVSTGLQDELSAVAVEETTTVERSRTASNADGGATRSESTASESTASEVFSHQSSRPSRNYASRSSAKPTASNQKTSSSQASSAASSSPNSGVLSAKIDAGAVPSTLISQIDSDSQQRRLSRCQRPSLYVHKIRA